MAIDTPTRDYAAQAATWAKIRALCEGVDGARRFVVPLPHTTPDEYAEFAKRAYYMPALPRTVETFAGLIFLRAPLIKAPETLKPYLDDVDLAGTSFDNIAAQVVSEVLRTNRVAVHVDHPPAPDGLSRLDAERAGLRAYARTYNAESIIGAEYSYTGGARKLWRVRLAETHVETNKNFEQVEIKRVRVLELRDGVYTQTVWQQSPGGDWAIVEPTMTPVRNGRPLDYLPIYFFSDADHDATARRPTLSDLADVSISHLNSATLLEWGEMWTANPTPWFAGVQAPPTDENGVAADGSKPAIRLGSSEAILLDKEGSAGYLEFGGAGLKQISDTLARKAKDMAALGARLLADDTRQVLAAETARIQRAGESSTLGRVSGVCSSGLTYVLRELAQWAGQSTGLDAITVQLNKNFVPAGMAPQEITALLGAVQAGQMSSAEFFEVLKSKDVIDQEKEFEAHLAEIEEDGGRIAERDAWLLDRPQDDPNAPPVAA